MRFTIRQLLIATAIIGCLAYACTWIPRLDSNTIAIKNEFERKITAIELTLTSLDNRSSKTWKLDSLETGEFSVFEHDYNDSYAVIQYSVDGETVRHDHGYVDLWRGEQWLFLLDADGQLQAKYGYPKLAQ